MKQDLQGESLKVQIEESLSAENSRRFLNEFVGLFKTGGSFKNLEVDIKAIAAIDSLGVNLLVGISRECQNRGIGFRVTGASASILRLFELYKLTGYFGIA